MPTGSLQAMFERLMEYVKESRRDGEPISRDPLVRQKMAQLAIQRKIALLLSYRIPCMIAKGMAPGYAAAVSKVLVTELEVAVGDVGTQIMGLYGQLQEGSKGAPLNGEMELWHRWIARRPIAAGSNEIQRTIIATRGLELPRG